MEEQKQKGANSRSLLLPFLVSLAGTLILVVAFFLPYASSYGESREVLSGYSQITSEIGFGSLKDISLLDLARLYGSIGGVLGWICVAIISIAGVFSLFALLFTLLKKPVPMLIFDLFTFGAFSALAWDLSDRGVLPNSHYQWGLAYYAYYIGAAILFAGAIWMLIAKIRAKQQKRKLLAKE